MLAALRRELDRGLGAGFDHVAWSESPEAGHASGKLPSLTADVLFSAVREVVRNAAEHGRGAEGPRSLHLTLAAGFRDGLEISVTDDGVGIPLTALDDEGHGLGLYATLLAVLGGSLTVELASPGSTVVLWVPAAAPS